MNLFIIPVNKDLKKKFADETYKARHYLTNKNNHFLDSLDRFIIGVICRLTPNVNNYGEY